MPSNDPACPVTDDEAARLWPVVADLLRSAPAVWETLDRNRLTAIQDRGLGLLTAAGFVERRSAHRYVIPGSPVVVEATFTFTGDGGLDEAMEPVAQELFRVWNDHLAAGRYSGGKPVRAEPNGPTEWRITEMGEMAKADLADEGKAATAFDWILRRGLFDGQRRATRDRHVVHLEHVAGRGRVERLIVRDAEKELATVHVSNHADIGEAVAKAFAPLVPPLVKAMKESAASVTPTPAPVIDDEWAAIAKALSGNEPDVLVFLDEEKAHSAGAVCDKTTIGEELALTPTQVDRAVRALRKKKLAKSHPGRKGGVYLLAKGRNVAAWVSPNDLKNRNLRDRKKAAQPLRRAQ